MPLAFLLTFDAPKALAAGLALALCAALASWINRPALPRLTCILAGMGLFLLALAAGGPLYHRPVQREVAVMVDLSASTRGAAYRDPRTLRRRIAELLGKTPHRILYFAAENRSALPDSPELPDLPCDQTRFAPPPAGAILLFSDARFDITAHAPQVYIAADPLLEEPADASVRRLEIRGRTLAADIANTTAAPRQLALASAKPVSIPPGSQVITRPLSPNTQDITAYISGADLWPENDRLAIHVPPPTLSQRWWVGANAPAGWRSIEPRQLPIEPAEYLAPSAIVLANISAADLSDLQRQRLAQYVRDLGGALVILGGDRAFAAGDYTGTPLDSLSPLASVPPNPTLHWILLADSSGSMSEGPPLATRWDMVRQAILSLLPHLPPDDPVTIGDFAEQIRWWSRAKSARDTVLLPLPPARVQPSGPTNLEAAILNVIAASDGAMPRELLILSDADAEFTQLSALKAGLAQKKIRLHLLDTYGKGRGLAELNDLAATTGGRVLIEMDAKNWVAAAQRLLALAAPDRLVHQPAAVRFTGDLRSLGESHPPLWNRTWIKSRALVLAEAATSEGSVPMAARWQIGTGTVLAVAFPLSPATAHSVAVTMAHPPADPRFKIAWDAGARLRVTIDAVDGSAYMNGLSFGLEVSAGADVSSHTIPQTAPGRYELAIAAPRQPAFAAVRHDSRILDRAAIAGRYAPEFEAIGNDRQAMLDLAARTGGAVIAPTQTRPIAFHWPREAADITTWLAAAGAALLAVGLLVWRLR